MTLKSKLLTEFPPLLHTTGHDTSADQLSDWLKGSAQEIREQLTEQGVLLIRGVPVHQVAEFDAVCRSITPDLADYTAGGSPRTRISGNIYTSTEYPAGQSIPLHCEYTYFRNIPGFIWFWCQTPPVSGGETPVGDMHGVLERLDPTLLERFDRLGVRYIYNLHGGNGFGRGWRESFGTDDRATVEHWLQSNTVEHRWQTDGTLSMKLFGPGLRTHASSGVRVWGNQVVNWHVGALGKAVAERMRRIYKQDEQLPKHATFGDGSPIPDTDVAHMMAALAAEERVFTWQAGDIMLCDNQRIAHGRRPFAGERRVLVALA